MCVCVRVRVCVRVLLSSKSCTSALAHAHAHKHTQHAARKSTHSTHKHACSMRTGTRTHVDSEGSPREPMDTRPWCPYYCPVSTPSRCHALCLTECSAHYFWRGKGCAVGYAGAHEIAVMKLAVKQAVWLCKPLCLLDDCNSNEVASSSSGQSASFLLILLLKWLVSVAMSEVIARPIQRVRRCCMSAVLRISGFLFMLATCCARCTAQLGYMCKPHQVGGYYSCWPHVVLGAQRYKATCVNSIKLGARSCWSHAVLVHSVVRLHVRPSLVVLGTATHV